jgi:hypothetical protein
LFHPERNAAEAGESRLGPLSPGRNRLNKCRLPRGVLAHLHIEFNIYRLPGGEGGIRTLGTGYPVRQISNAASVVARWVLDETPWDSEGHEKDRSASSHLLSSVRPRLAESHSVREVITTLTPSDQQTAVEEGI